jgi:hypothetical protein
MRAAIALCSAHSCAQWSHVRKVPTGSPGHTQPNAPMARCCHLMLLLAVQGLTLLTVAAGSPAAVNISPASLAESASLLSLQDTAQQQRATQAISTPPNMDINHATTERMCLVHIVLAHTACGSAHTQYVHLPGLPVCCASTCNIVASNGSARTCCVSTCSSCL